MNKLSLVLLASASLVFAWGCSRSANIVKNRTLSEYPDITIGAAFNERFYNTKWKTVTEKGRKIVRFTGKIKRGTHDLAVKYGGYGLYDENEFSIRIKPYLDAIRQFEKANEDNVQKFNLLDGRYKELGRKKGYAGHGSIEFKKIEDDIKLLDKEYKEFQAKFDIDEYSKKVRQLTKESHLAIDKNKKELCADFLKNSCWVTGSVVEFDFTLYPDEKNFEVTRFYNDSWAKSNLTLATVFRIIFSKE